MPKHPPIHTVVYGGSGTGKSHYAATYPKPLLVLLFDPRGKEGPYLDQGTLGPYSETNIGKIKTGDLLLPSQEVLNAKGEPIIRIEFFHEEGLTFDELDPEKVTGWQVLPKLRKRLNTLFKDEQDKWRTVVFDSTTSAELSIRNYHRFVQNAGARDPRQHWSAATNELEMLLETRFASWRANLVVICHTDKDKASDDTGGILRYNPRLPGRLSSDISAYFPEVHHTFVQQGDKDITYLVQTRASNLYTATSIICKAPNPTLNDYRALWPKETKDEQ